MDYDYFEIMRLICGNRIIYTEDDFAVGRIKKGKIMAKRGPKRERERAVEEEKREAKK